MTVYNWFRNIIQQLRLLFGDLVEPVSRPLQFLPVPDFKGSALEGQTTKRDDHLPTIVDKDLRERSLDATKDKISAEYFDDMVQYLYDYLQNKKIRIECDVVEEYLTQQKDWLFIAFCKKKNTVREVFHPDFYKDTMKEAIRLHCRQQVQVVT
jgi:hypothetical protein